MEKQKKELSLSVNEISSIPKDRLTIEEIMSNPIAVGYLLKFCESSFCAENLHFWVAVDQFKDKCKTLSWVDEESDIKICGSMVTAIWQEFLCENSTTEVSLPSNDRKETIDRISKLSNYRADVFESALADPMKTLRKDIKPRFVASKYFSELVDQENQSIKDKLETIPAPKGTLLEFDFPDNKVEFSIDEIVNDKYLYSAMLEFLQSKFCSENLLCLREIHLFEDLCKKSDNNNSVSKVVWSIYRHFIAPGSPYEISCTDLIRKSIMQRIASPKAEMFNDVKVNCMELLKQDYIQFEKSPGFEEVVNEMKAEKKKMGGGGRFRVFNPFNGNGTAASKGDGSGMTPRGGPLAFLSPRFGGTPRKQTPAATS